MRSCLHCTAYEILISVRSYSTICCKCHTCLTIIRTHSRLCDSSRKSEFIRFCNSYCLSSFTITIMEKFYKVCTCGQAGYLKGSRISISCPTCTRTVRASIQPHVISTTIQVFYLKGSFTSIASLTSYIGLAYYTGSKFFALWYKYLFRCHFYITTFWHLVYIDIINSKVITIRTWFRIQELNFHSCYSTAWVNSS